MIFNRAALFNHILSVIPLPDAMVSYHPTVFGRAIEAFLLFGRDEG